MAALPRNGQHRDQEGCGREGRLGGYPAARRRDVAAARWEREVAARQVALQGSGLVTGLGDWRGGRRSGTIQRPAQGGAQRS